MREQCESNDRALGEHWESDYHEIAYCYFGLNVCAFLSYNTLSDQDIDIARFPLVQ